MEETEKQKIWKLKNKTKQKINYTCKICVTKNYKKITSNEIQYKLQ